MPAIPAPGVNPALNDPEAPTHIATARLCFVDGQLHQLWQPIDWEAHAYEWRPVDAEVTPAPPIS